uniref:Uncharacterized protein n=1 Tax=Arundo donax TaxID=35708 RepID=A0A0A8YGF2_ARUDO
MMEIDVGVVEMTTYGDGDARASPRTWWRTWSSGRWHGDGERGPWSRPACVGRNASAAC